MRSGWCVVWQIVLYGTSDKMYSLDKGEKATSTSDLGSKMYYIQ